MNSDALNDMNSLSQVERRLAAAGHSLPEIKAQGNYAIATLWQGTILAAGQLSRTDSGAVTGLARGPEDLPEVHRACEIGMLRAIAAVRTLVHLDSVKQLVFLRGFIAASPTFVDHTAALNAASELLSLAFGPAVAAPARSAIGVASLPSGGLIELELVVGI